MIIYIKQVYVITPLLQDITMRTSITIYDINYDENTLNSNFIKGSCTELPVIFIQEDSLAHIIY